MVTLKQIDENRYEIYYRDEFLGFLTYDENYDSHVTLLARVSISVLALIVAEGANIEGVRKYKAGLAVKK